MNVGIRDLKNNLSRHLERVRAGDSITVTNHGKPVARLVPMEGQSAMEGQSTLKKLIAEGRVTPAKRKKRPAPPPIDAGTTLSDLVAEQRR